LASPEVALKRYLCQARARDNSSQADDEGLMADVPPTLDQAVSQWFADHGLSVHETHYQFDYEFYAWRYNGDKKSFTLWISEIAAEDYEPKTILFILKDFDPKKLMEGQRSVHLHVKSNESEFGAYVRSNFSPSAA
jgi:hypothetical protein